jgi:hypothetical protein
MKVTIQPYEQVFPELDASFLETSEQEDVVTEELDKLFKAIDDERLFGIKPDVQPASVASSERQFGKRALASRGSSAPKAFTKVLGTRTWRGQTYRYGFCQDADGEYLTAELI